MRSTIGLLLPSKCVVCGEMPHPCCLDCRPKVAVREFHREVSPDLSVESAAEKESLTGFSGARYTPELAKLLGAYKDSGQMWLLRDLAPLARAAILAALEQGQSLGAQPNSQYDAPEFITYLGSSVRNYRKRGYNPALNILRGATGGINLPVIRTLVPGRSVVDQATLTAADRATNIGNSLRLVQPPFETWRRALLFDDVVTTGSTLLAARQALRAARVEVVAVATLADVERRIQFSPPQKWA